MGRKKQVPKSDRWLRANPLPTTATNELIVSWVARYEQEVGSVDQVRRPSQNYVEGGSGWQCGVCDLCFPIPEPIEVHEPQVVRQFYTHSQACRVSWLQQRSRQAEMAEGGAAGGAEEEAADISEVPLTTQLTSPDPNINIQYASLRAIAPQVHAAFLAEERSVHQERTLKAAIEIMVLLRQMAPLKKGGKGKHKDLAAVKDAIGKLDMPIGDWVAELWKKSAIRKKNTVKRGITGETGDILRVTKSPRRMGEEPSPPMKTRLDKDAKFRLVHCIIDSETTKLMDASGITADRTQLDASWSNQSALWTRIKELFHDSSFNPKLEEDLISGFVAPRFAFPDPQYQGHVIPEHRLTGLYKIMRTVRSAVCRDLPSGTNSNEWGDIFDRCEKYTGGADGNLEVFYLLRLVHTHSLATVNRCFISLNDEKVRHEQQSWAVTDSAPGKNLEGEMLAAGLGGASAKVPEGAPTKKAASSNTRANQVSRAREDDRKSHQVP